MGRWTQYDEDAARLPEGMERIGYDADTERYTFQDRYTGTLYQSEPGNVYGTLTPVSSGESNGRRIRPNAFASTNPAEQRTKTSVNTNINSFDDFVPSHAITSPTSPRLFMRSPTSDSSSGLSLADAFRRVKAMSSVISKIQTTAGNDAKSSLPSSVSSGYSSRDPSSPPPMPTRRMRGYSKLPDIPREEDKKALLRSKTMSSVSSSRHAPTRSSSRVSTVSTTSTITPLKTA